MLDFDVGVILAAAGSGERMGNPLPKQYTKILDRPLFMYSLEEFLAFKFVKRIALVVDNREMMMAELQKHGHADSEKISLVNGGKTRHRSIQNGLLHLERYNDAQLKVIVIHDAVRPFIPSQLLLELIKAAVEIGAAGPTQSLISTIVKPDDNLCLETSLERSNFAKSETPQAFQLDILSKSYSKISEEELDCGTECLQLVLNNTGVRAKLIHTSENLHKVTYSQDIPIVENALRVKSIDICIISEKQSHYVDSLAESLNGKVAALQCVTGWPTLKNRGNGKTFNSIILLHDHEIEQDLLDFANLIDLDKQGLIIHIIDNAAIDGFQNMSVYNLHRNSRKMAHHYEKLNKGVVVIHCVSNDTNKLSDIVVSLVRADPLTFSGQTLFL